MSITIVVTYWRDIPSSVEAKKSRREKAKKMLDERFMIAIDKAAMLGKAHEADDYLMEWRKSAPVEVEGDDMDIALDEFARKLEQEIDDDQLEKIVKNKGYKI